MKYHVIWQATPTVPIEAAPIGGSMTIHAEDPCEVVHISFRSIGNNRYMEAAKQILSEAIKYHAKISMYSCNPNTHFGKLAFSWVWWRA